MKREPGVSGAQVGGGLVQGVQAAELVERSGRRLVDVVTEMNDEVEVLLGHVAARRCPAVVSRS
jgi:hypothetical protein